MKHLFIITLLCIVAFGAYAKSYNLSYNENDFVIESDSSSTSTIIGPTNTIYDEISGDLIVKVNNIITGEEFVYKVDVDDESQLIIDNVFLDSGVYAVCLMNPEKQILNTKKIKI